MLIPGPAFAFLKLLPYEVCAELVRVPGHSSTLGQVREVWICMPTPGLQRSVRDWIPRAGWAQDVTGNAKLPHGKAHKIWKKKKKTKRHHHHQTPKQTGKKPRQTKWAKDLSSCLLHLSAQLCVLSRDTCGWKQQNTKSLPHHRHCPIPYSLGIILISVLLPWRAPGAPWRNCNVFRDDVHLLNLDVIKQLPSVLSQWQSQGYHHFPQLLFWPPLHARSLYSYSSHSDACCQWKVPLHLLVCRWEGHPWGLVWWALCPGLMEKNQWKRSCSF